MKLKALSIFAAIGNLTATASAPDSRPWAPVLEGKAALSKPADDLVPVFQRIGHAVTKDKFEKTDSWRKRLALNSDSGKEYRFVVAENLDVLAYPDKDVFVVRTCGFDATGPKEDPVLTVRTVNDGTTTKQMQNAFGATTTVSADIGTRYKVRITNWTSFPRGVIWEQDMKYGVGLAVHHPPPELLDAMKRNKVPVLLRFRIGDISQTKLAADYTGPSLEFPGYSRISMGPRARQR